MRRGVTILEKSIVIWMLGELLFVTDHILRGRVSASLGNHVFLLSVLNVNFRIKVKPPLPT